MKAIISNQVLFSIIVITSFIYESGVSVDIRSYIAVIVGLVSLSVIFRFIKSDIGYVFPPTAIIDYISSVVIVVIPIIHEIIDLTLLSGVIISMLMLTIKMAIIHYLLIEE